LADLNFQVEEIDGVYHCSWTATNISTFEKIHILHSPFPLKENQNIEDVHFLLKSTFDTQLKNNYELTVATNEFLPVFFQLYIDIGDRFLKSDIITFGNKDGEAIDVISKYGFHYPEKNAFYLFSEFQNKLIYYDYLEQKVKKEIKVNFDFDEFKYAYSNNTFGEELYLIDHKKLLIFDANTLELTGSYEANRNINSVATNDNGIIVISISDNVAPIQILSRNEMTVLNVIDAENPTHNSPSILALSKDENQFLEVGESWLRSFELNGQGQILVEDLKINPYLGTSTDDLITSAPSGNYVIHSQDGHIFDREKNSIQNLSSIFGDRYSSFFFDEGEDFLYATSDNFLLQGEDFIDKFSVPDFEFIDRKIYEKDIPINLFLRDGEIQVLFISKDLFCAYVKPLDF